MIIFIHIIDFYNFLFKYFESFKYLNNYLFIKGLFIYIV